MHEKQVKYILKVTNDCLQFLRKLCCSITVFTILIYFEEDDKNAEKILLRRCTFEENLAHQSLMCGEIETGQSAERLLMPPIVKHTVEKHSSKNTLEKYISEI